MIKIYCVSQLPNIYDTYIHFNVILKYFVKVITVLFAAVKEYKFLQSIKSKLFNDSEEIGEIDVVNKFFSEFEAYHNDKINLKVALSPYKVSLRILFYNY